MTADNRGADPQVAAITIENIKKLVAASGGPVVEYFFAGDRVVIFVVAPDGKVTATFSPQSAEAIKGAAAEIKDLMEGSVADQSTRNRVHGTLTVLHAALIAPIEAVLPSDPDVPVTIVPARSLFNVPFAALISADGSPVVERHALSHAASIAVLGYLHDRAERTHRLLALVNPSPMPPEFSPLDEIQQDFPHIARFYAGGRNARVLTGSQATFAALQQAGGDYDVINPTTHAVAFDTADRESYIVLAPGDGSDGIVPVHRIFDLKLNADLVMLVAWQSGEGGVSGDGVNGLARAFAVAGASSLIVSLWTVPQEVPEQIFDFHAAWLEQGLGKAQALRRVQLKWMRNSREQPNVWAALALYGRAR